MLIIFIIGSLLVSFYYGIVAVRSSGLNCYEANELLDSFKSTILTVLTIAVGTPIFFLVIIGITEIFEFIGNKISFPKIPKVQLFTIPDKSKLIIERFFVILLIGILLIAIGVLGYFGIVELFFSDPCQLI